MVVVMKTLFTIIVFLLIVAAAVGLTLLWTALAVAAAGTWMLDLPFATGWNSVWDNILWSLLWAFLFLGGVGSSSRAAN